MKNKTKFFTAMLCLLFSTALFSQTTFLDSAKARYDSLQPYVPTGKLLDRNPQWIFATAADYNPLHFHPDSVYPCNPRIFKDLYTLFYHTDFQNQDFTIHPDDFDRVTDSVYYGQALSDPTNTQAVMGLQPQADFMLNLLHFDYNYLSQEAYDSSLIRWDAGINKYLLNAGSISIHDTIFLDTANRSTQPNDIIVMDTSYYRDPAHVIPRVFKTKSMLAAALIKGHVACLENLNKGVRYHLNRFGSVIDLAKYIYFMDFDDGNGYVEVIPGQSRTVFYNSYGVKELRIGWIERQFYQGGLEGLAHKSAGFVTVKHCQLGWPDAVITNPDHNPCRVPMEEGIGKMVGFVKYRHGGNGKLMKPAIVVEGLETGLFVEGQPEYDQGNVHGFGELNWLSFSSGDFGDAVPQLEKFPEFADSLRAAGYDVIIVDLHSNRSTIQRNANGLINLIQAVNDSLIKNGSNEELVVIGASMGGLLVRYALRKMELSGCCHNTRVYMTFSSPHRGANIPLGLQHFLYELGTSLNALGQGDKAKALYDHVLNSPVARQMLVYHKESSALAERLAFQAELDSIGQPQYCRRFALTNGSGQGIGQRSNPELNQGAFMQPGDPLASILFKVKVPVIFPDPFTPMLTLGSLLKPGSSGNFTLVNATAYAVDNSPMQPSSKLVFKRGQSVRKNAGAFIFHMDMWMAGVYTLFTNTVAHKTASATSLATNACALCPAIGGSLYASTLWIGGVFTSSLLTHQIVHQSTNHPEPFTEKALYPTLPYDNVPGDYNITQGRIADLSGGLVTAYFPQHAFISSVSALDLDTNDLHLDIETAKRNLLREEKLHFEDIWFNHFINDEISVNQRHVKITDANLRWVTKKLRESQGPLSSSGANGSPVALNTLFNYGLPDSSLVAPEKFIRSADILIGGNLHVNRFAKVGYSTSAYNSTKKLSHFDISTGNPTCGGSHVVIQNQGVFTVGDNNYTPPTQESNTATVHFLKNSTLEIKAGGRLRIHNRSRLIIEEGATLIFHPGAIIELDGTEAVLEVAGILHLKPNAQFKFQGSGFIRFAQQMESFAHANDFWITGANSDTTSKRLEVTANCYISHFGLDSVDFKNMRVELAPAAQLHISRKFNSNEVCYAQKGSGEHEGVWVYGQNEVDIQHSYFYGGRTGLGALLTRYGNEMEIHHCKFFNQSENGLYTEGQGAKVRYCGFYDGNTGWKALNMTKACNLFQSQFKNNSQKGVDFKGQSAVSLHVESCLMENSPTGLHTASADVRMVCTRAINNTTGLLCEEGYLDIGSEARNSITNNDVGIHAVNMLGLRLKDGENHFFGNLNYYVYGNMGAGHNLGNPAQLDIYDNNTPATNGNVLISLTDHLNNPVSIVNFSNNGLYNTWPCFVVPTALNGMVLNYPSLKVISTSNYPNYYFSDALFDAIAMVSYEDYIGNDLTAISRLNEILGVPLTDMGDNERYLREYGFRMMMKALTNAYEQKLLPLNRAIEDQEENPYLQIVIDEIDERLQDIDAASATAYEEEYRLTLSKAHIYRLAEHYDYALNLLQASGNWASGADLFETEYWRCVCEAEEELLQGELDAEAYLDRKDQCQQMLSAKKAAYAIETGLTSPVNYHPAFEKGGIRKIAPNPARDYVEVELDSFEKQRTLQLKNTEGVVVQQRAVTDGETHIRWVLNSLPKGAYMLYLLNGQQLLDVKKLIVQ